MYFGTPEATRVVSAEADKFLFRDLRPRLHALPSFDVRGRWVGSETVPWETTAETPPVVGDAATLTLWERQEA